ncbi:MAG: hypothetical protein BJ554DRAFT_3174 [Olpidium bornovanus]|uniref:Reverse transcriptase Ty1/copia-type domain-containing protein n=1 Tax=Olpidium bornovanus TaxID=278681 RepID=A0A8H7ZNV1_9FUNG|nr:MAG: hypothetical protein BJ554DRAFT_3174 [Olpidium bornovanus]
MDNILIAGPDKALITKIEAELESKFKMSDGSNLTFILGVRVSAHQDGMRAMDQSHYDAQLLSKYGMQGAKPVATPLEKGAMESLVETGTDATPIETGRYAEAIGSLLWLASMTRPDMAFAAAFLARFSAFPNARHWGTVKRAFRYLRGTTGIRITFTGPYGTSGASLTVYRAVGLAADVKISKRSKHINIKYHHLRRCAADGIIRIEHVSSTSNLADVCTKPIERIKFAGLRDKLGMRVV